ncbi:MAG: 3'-5' exonuclease [Sphaerochaetaceae bacterium]|nr:3'-5' exonuclease [Sphaerochaetaceae bacterium]
MQYSFIDKSSDFDKLISQWKEQGVDCVAMDFEEESNLHCYGEHVCTIQLYDKANYYLVDALALQKTPEGLSCLKTFLEGPITKIMFACQSDASLARKAMKIQLENIYDTRVPALALGFTGNLTGLIERNLGIASENPALKKKYQTANWMRRPIPDEQIEYALSDVQYLFELRDSLEAEMAKTLNASQIKQVRHSLTKCAVQVRPERPGWEKICNFKMLKPKEKIYIKHFFLARDNLARKANVPAANILAKQLIVAMAKKGTWKGYLDDDKMRYKTNFEKARLDAEEELKTLR